MRRLGGVTAAYDRPTGSLGIGVALVNAYAGQ